MISCRGREIGELGAGRPPLRAPRPLRRDAGLTLHVGHACLHVSNDLCRHASWKTWPQRQAAHERLSEPLWQIAHSMPESDIAGARHAKREIETPAPAQVRGFASSLQLGAQIWLAAHISLLTFL